MSSIFSTQPDTQNDNPSCVQVLLNSDYFTFTILYFNTLLETVAVIQLAFLWCLKQLRGYSFIHW